MNTEAEMMQIESDAIIPNAHRDFDINPIKKEQVAKLVRSYEENNDFGVIPVRLVLVDGEEFYEQASGHHRLEAMRQLNYEWIDCKLLPVTTTDADMLSLMIDENAMQYGGDPSHQLDSVAAAAKQIAYWMFLSEGLRQTGEFSPVSLFDDQDGFARAKGQLIESATIGRRTVSKLIGEALSEDVVRSKMSELNDSGKIASIISDARGRVDAETEAREEEERIAEEERKAEEAELARLEKLEVVAAKKREADRKRLAKEAKAAKDKLAKQRILTEQKRAKDEEARQLRLKKARDAEIKRLAEERKLAEEREAKRKSDMEKSQSAADEKERNKTLNPAVVGLFGNTSQVEEFRLLAKNYPAIFPVAAQPDYVERMIKTLKNTGNLTKRDIRDHMKQDILKHDDFARQREERMQKIREAESAGVRAAGVADRFSAWLGNGVTHLSDIDKIMSSPDHRALFLHNMEGVTIRQHLDNLEHMINVLRENGVGHADYNAGRDAIEVEGTIVN